MIRKYFNYGIIITFSVLTMAIVVESSIIAVQRSKIVKLKTEKNLVQQTLRKAKIEAIERYSIEKKYRQRVSELEGAEELDDYVKIWMED